MKQLERTPPKRNSANSPEEPAVQERPDCQAVRRSSKKRKMSLRSRIVFAIVVLIASACSIGIGAHTAIRMNEADHLAELAQQVQQATETTSTVTEPSQTQVTSIPTTQPATVPATTAPAAPVKKNILPQYTTLYEKNPEIFGWIRIDDTRIDYPVMHTPDDPEKYLHADFNGQYSYSGLPFLDASCTEDSDNLLIYAHNMLDGSMFRSLLKYESKDYWQQHPVISFDTLYETQEYEVLSAFYDRVYYKTETCFKFYQFIDAENEEDYNHAISQFKEKQLYNTGITAEYGDQLITLVTCAYHTDNGRFVVVARKVPEETSPNK